MDITSWSTVVSQIGFPIAVALLVLLRFDKTQQRMNELLIETVTLLRLLVKDSKTRFLIDK